MSAATVPVSVAQLEALLDFMERNPKLAVGAFQRSKEGRSLSQRLWQECAIRLNSLETGCRKEVEEWRAYYASYKSKTLKRITERKKPLNASGGGQPARLDISPLQARLLAILGRDIGDSLPRVQHNPISQPASTRARPLLRGRRPPPPPDAQESEIQAAEARLAEKEHVATDRVADAANKLVLAAHRIADAGYEQAAATARMADAMHDQAAAMHRALDLLQQAIAAGGIPARMVMQSPPPRRRRRHSSHSSDVKECYVED